MPLLAVVLICCQKDQPPVLLDGELEDCTEYHHERLGKDPPSIPDQAVSRMPEIFRTVRMWAFESCMLPCEFDVCGAVTYADTQSVSIYLSMPEPYAGEDFFIIGPEAFVVVDIESLSIVDQGVWHGGTWYSGCVVHRRECMEWYHAQLDSAQADSGL